MRRWLTFFKYYFNRLYKVCSGEYDRDRDVAPTIYILRDNILIYV